MRIPLPKDKRILTRATSAATFVVASVAFAVLLLINPPGCNLLVVRDCDQATLLSILFRGIAAGGIGALVVYGGYTLALRINRRAQR